jgi:Uri superfamily endonuclease
VKGIYCLVIEVRRNVSVTIGARGKIFFQKGFYGYVGSAQNGLEKRLARHFSREKTLRWHVDYLLADEAVRPVRAYIKAAGKKEECRMADRLGRKHEPVNGFGCSDCRCGSHLFRLDEASPVPPARKGWMIFPVINKGALDP